MNKNLSLATFVATSAIASTVLFSGNANAKSPCGWSIEKSSHQWQKTPVVALLTIPGIVLAATLYVSGRSHQD